MALGVYPVTVLDQANAMATFAAGGRRSDGPLRRAGQQGLRHRLHAQPAIECGAEPAAVADVTWVLSQNPAGQLPDDRPSASLSGSARLGTSALDTAHAWQVGYTGNLAMAVWVGNRDTELPLRDKLGNRITGAGLPAEIYRAFMGSAHDRLGLPMVEFPTRSSTATPPPATRSDGHLRDS